MINTIQLQDNAYTRRQRNILRQRAQDYLNTEISVLDYAAFSSYWISGSREPYHTKYFDRRGRLLVFSLMAWLEPEETRYFDALCETIWQICSEPFWCIPPHFYDEKRKDLPFERYADQLDLFSCETAFALAETRHLLKDRLPDMIQQQIQLQIERRVFAPWLNPDRKFFFEGYPNNWASVCPSCIGGAALYLVDDETKLSQILSRCMSCFDVYFSSFGEDGICLEGPDYFSYGFGMFTSFAQLLETRTEGKTDLFNREKIRIIAAAQPWFYLSGKEVINFADCREGVKCRMGISQYLHEKVGAAVPPVAEDILDDECYRYCLALRDLIWCTSAELPESPDRCGWLEDAQWFLSKSGPLTLAAKGGHNGQSHGHNDCGSFILFTDGEACVCDPGAGQYTAAYFSPQRYQFLTTSSRGHNVPVVNGYLQEIGPDCRASVIVTETASPLCSFQAEIGSCYPKEAGLVSLVRRFEHNTADDTVTLTDEGVFREAGVLCENFCGREKIQLFDDYAVFSRNGKHIKLSFDASYYSAAVKSEEYLNIDNQRCTAWFLQLTSRIPGTAQKFTAVFKQINHLHS